MVERTTNRRRWKPTPATLALLVLTAALTVMAAVVGVADNPPGIALLYAGGVTLILAGTHRWRSPKRFGTLLVVSAVGFVLNVLVHNFSEVGAEMIAHLPVLASMLMGISIVTFFLAVIVCPVGGLVGAVGGIVTSVIRLRRPA
jgi:hypothetical protein